MLFIPRDMRGRQAGRQAGDLFVYAAEWKTMCVCVHVCVGVCGCHVSAADKGTV